MKLSALILGGLIAATSAKAEILPINGVDFMVDYDLLVGRVVHISEGTVFSASRDYALLSLPGGAVSLRPPWVEREDLRYLFQHCTETLTGEECRLGVTGLVEEPRHSDIPVLTGVKFHPPRTVRIGSTDLRQPQNGDRSRELTTEEQIEPTTWWHEIEHRHDAPVTEPIY